MNAALANRSYKKAYNLYIYMNELRAEEGLEKLIMKSLEKRFEN